jgi:GT2 family glycosyltransferase
MAPRRPTAGRDIVGARCAASACSRRVSVITVTYRSETHLRTAWDSAMAAAAYANVEAEMVLVDNASPDQSVDVTRAAYPAAVVIENAENVGYGAASNQAFERASGEYWLLLNPDAVIDRDGLSSLIAFLDGRPAAGAVGARIVEGPQAHSENAGMAPGLRSLAGHFLLLNRVVRSGPWRGVFVTRGAATVPVRVDWCTAAVLLVRPEAIRAVGGFDPTFFLYGEDVDLGMRLNAAGWEVWVDPRATAQHAIGGSQRGVSARWVDGTLEVVRRNSGAFRTRLAAAVMTAGLSGRAALLHLRRRDSRHAAVTRASAVRALAHVLGRAHPTRTHVKR